MTGNSQCLYSTHYRAQCSLDFTNRNILQSTEGHALIYIFFVLLVENSLGLYLSMLAHKIKAQITLKVASERFGDPAFLDS